MGSEANGRSIAMYWDFENLHAGLLEAKDGEGTYSKQDNRFKPQAPLVDVQALVELGAPFGSVALNRAYCNWQFFGPTIQSAAKCSHNGLGPPVQEAQSRDVRRSRVPFD